jgi:hypothetical protein
LTYISTFDSSQQIIETSETEYLKIEQKEVCVKTQCTQTDYCNSRYNQVKDKFVQTDETRIFPDDTIVSESRINTDNTPNVDREELNQHERNADHKRHHDLIKLHEEEVIDEEPNIRNDSGSDNAMLRETEKAKRSLEVLKKKRKELKRQLESIYKDTYQTDRRSPSERRYTQPLSYSPSCLHLDHSKSQRYVDNRSGRKWTNTSSFRCISTQPELPLTRSIVKNKQRGYMTSCNPLLPYHLQRRDSLRNKMTRERIISEPTEIEMKTFIYKPFVSESQTLKDTETDKELMMNTYFMNEKTTIIRQSTV